MLTRNHGGMATANGITGRLNITVFPLTRTFHPTLQINIHPVGDTPNQGTEGCYALLHLVLPDAVFVDKDELTDLWGPATVPRAFDPSLHPSQGSEGSVQQPSPFGVKAWTIAPKVIDIERPVHSSRKPEAAVEDHRVKLSVTLDLFDGGMVLEIPLHGRYLIPNHTGKQVITIFGDQSDGNGGLLRGGWMCGMSSDPAQSESSKSYQEVRPLLIPSRAESAVYALPPTPSSPNQPDGQATTVQTQEQESACFHVEIAAGPLSFVHPDPPITLTLPTGHPSHQLSVEIITALVIWLGGVYLVWKIWRLVCRVGKDETGGKREKSE